MKLSDYVSFDGLGLAELVRKGEVSSSELTKAAFKASDAVNDKIFAVAPVYTALEKIPKELIEASLDLGATPWITFRRVLLPLSIPGIVAGSIFTFALSFGDFVTPTLLGGPSGIMISNIIIGQFGAAFDWPFGSALAIVVLLVALLTIIIASYFERRKHTGS